MQKAHSSCLFRRSSGLYYFRRAVPSDLIGRVGLSEWKKSLKTREPTRARLLAAELYSDTQRTIEQLRGAKRAVAAEAPGTFTDDQVLQRAQRKFARGAYFTSYRTRASLLKGRVTGSGVQDDLEVAELNLAHLRATTPWTKESGDHFAGIVRELEAECGRTIEPNSELEGKIRFASWDANVKALEVRIAHFRGDRVGMAQIENLLLPTKTSLGDLLELYRRNRVPKWSPKTRVKFDSVATLLRAILGNDMPLEDIDRAVLRELRDTLQDLPPNYSKRRVLRGLSPQGAAKRARELGLPSLSRTSVVNFLGHVSAILGFALREELIDKNPAAKMEVATAPQKSARRAFKPEELNRIFSAPVFRGSVDDGDNWRRPAPIPLKRGRYWVPLIALHTGMRLNEICFLRRDDVKEVDGVWCIEVSDSGGRRLKTEHARRHVPVHAQLEKLGFLKWVHELDAAGDVDLFGDLQSSALGFRSDPFSKWFKKLRNSVGVSSASVTFHSFRHYFGDRLREATVSIEHQERIMGWGGTHIQREYGDGPSVSLLSRDIGRIAFPDVDLAALMPIQE